MSVDDFSEALLEGESQLALSLVPDSQPEEMSSMPEMFEVPRMGSVLVMPCQGWRRMLVARRRMMCWWLEDEERNGA